LLLQPISAHWTLSTSIIVAALLNSAFPIIQKKHNALTSRGAA
jgi:hypothetical protein